MDEPWVLLPLTREEVAHLYMTLKEKGRMIRLLANKSPDPAADLSIYGLNEGIKEKLEPFLLLLGVMRERQPAGGSKRAPADNR